jgi:hypothetical protein
MSARDGCTRIGAALKPPRVPLGGGIYVVLPGFFENPMTVLYSINVTGWLTRDGELEKACGC